MGKKIDVILKGGSHAWLDVDYVIAMVAAPVTGLAILRTTDGKTMHTQELCSPLMTKMGWK